MLIKLIENYSLSAFLSHQLYNLCLSTLIVLFPVTNISNHAMPTGFAQNLHKIISIQHFAALDAGQINWIVQFDWFHKQSRYFYLSHSLLLRPLKLTSSSRIFLTWQIILSRMIESDNNNNNNNIDLIFTIFKRPL